MNKVVKDFIKKNFVVHYDKRCGAFDIASKPPFGVNLSIKEWGAHQASFKKAIKVINKWNREKGEKYYFYVAAYIPNDVIEWLRSETSDFAVQCLVEQQSSWRIE